MDNLTKKLLQMNINQLEIILNDSTNNLVKSYVIKKLIEKKKKNIQYLTNIKPPKKIQKKIQKKNKKHIYLTKKKNNEHENMIDSILDDIEIDNNQRDKKNGKSLYVNKKKTQQINSRLFCDVQIKNIQKNKTNKLFDPPFEQ